MQIYEEKDQKQALPYEKYRIDSFKLLIDSCELASVNIPNEFILVDKSTGEAVDEFKKNSLKIPYKDTCIYVGIFNRVLRKVNISKLMILFSSKVAGDNYFEGISKQDVIDVLEHLKFLRYIDYSDVSDLYKKLYAKDVDIKKDMKFHRKDRDKIREFNKQLKLMFQHDLGEFHLYDSEDNFGLQTFNRDRSSISKPFFKWYDKTKEIFAKHYDFLVKLPDYLRNELQDNFIYRFEFTMKDKKFFNNFGISNRLEEVLEVASSKWSEIVKILMDKNFQPKAKRVTSQDKGLTPTEKVLALHFHTLWRKYDYTPAEIKLIYIEAQEGKLARHRAKKLFERIYMYVSQDYAKDVAANYEAIQSMGKRLGVW